MIFFQQLNSAVMHERRGCIHFGKSEVLGPSAITVTKAGSWSI